MSTTYGRVRERKVAGLWVPAQKTGSDPFRVRPHPQELEEAGAAVGEDEGDVALDQAADQQLAEGAERQLVVLDVADGSAAIEGLELVAVAPGAIRSLRLRVDEDSRRIPDVDASLPAHGYAVQPHAVLDLGAFEELVGRLQNAHVHEVGRDHLEVVRIGEETEHVFLAHVEPDFLLEDLRQVAAQVREREVELRIVELEAGFRG